MLWNARANKDGIETLLTGMKRADDRPSLRRFLPEVRDKYPWQFTTPALPGVITHVLGPPADPESRKNRKVPKSWGFRDDGSIALGNDSRSVFRRWAGTGRPHSRQTAVH